MADSNRPLQVSSQKFRSDVLLKEYEVTCAQIRDMVSYSDRMFGVGVTLIAAGFSYGVKEKLSEVAVAVSFLSIVLLVFSCSVYTTIFSLGGYRQHLEEELNSTLGDDVLRWETVVPFAVHRSLPVRCLTFLIFCLLVAVNVYGWKSATSLLASNAILLFIVQMGYAGAVILLAICYASLAAAHERAYRLARRSRHSQQRLSIGELALKYSLNLASVAQLDGDKLRILVTDDQSTDGSPEIIKHVAAQYPDKVTLVTGTDKPLGWTGKLFALQQARAMSDAHWLMLVDADVLVRKDLMGRALAYAESERLDALCVLPSFEYRSFWVGVVLPVMIWLSVMRVSPTQTNRRSSRKAFGFGNFILVRREAHDQIGGFSAYKSSILDDCEVMARLKNAGYSIAVVDGGPLINSPMYESLPTLFQGFLKNSYAALNYSKLELLKFAAAEVICIVLPLLGLLANSLFLVPLALFAATMIVAGVRVSAPWQFHVLFLLGHAISTSIVACSALLSFAGLNTRWKGRPVHVSQVAR